MDSTTAYVFSMDQSFPIGPANGHVLESVIVMGKLMPRAPSLITSSPPLGIIDVKGANFSYVNHDNWALESIKSNVMEPEEVGHFLGKKFLGLGSSLGEDVSIR